MIRTLLLTGVVTSWIFIMGCSPAPYTVEDPKSVPKLQFIETETGRWLVHDVNRPVPDVVHPGEPCFKSAPADAIVLFDGSDLSPWSKTDGSPAHWQLIEGAMEVRQDGDLRTRQEFGSCQLHLEFATPAIVAGSSQGRGNSGVFLQGRYEVQVLDSYDNHTYPDGQCGALYGRSVPLVNASRGPGQWQSYDILFRRPLFKDGEVVRKARFTVLHNGVLIQDHVELEGSTDWDGPYAVKPYRPHGDTGPLKLQDHGNPVRYRNIWLRPLDD